MRTPTITRSVHLGLGFCLFFAPWAQAEPAASFAKYCFACHSQGPGMGGINLQQLTTQASPAANYKQWRRVAAALEEKRMPPTGLPQPPEAERTAAIDWIHAQLDEYARRNDGDPGKVTVRRLTSAEYAYAVEDLTGLDLNLERDLGGDDVGGEGFTNYGDVQFVQDSNIERYLEIAKRVAGHAVIGAGALAFFQDPGRTGFELSAVSRISQIYRANGFRTVSGEGGQPFGLERYSKALFAAWQYRYRAELKQPAATLESLARRENTSPRLARHFWSVAAMPSLGYPTSEIVSRWRKLPRPSEASLDVVRAECDRIQKYMVTWPSWLFARGDVAAGGAGDERTLVFDDNSLRVEARRPFRFILGGRGPALPSGGTSRVYLNAVLANPDRPVTPVVVWRKATIAFRSEGEPPLDTQTGAQAGGQPAQRRTGFESVPKLPLKDAVTVESLQKLNFGTSLDGSRLAPGDFSSQGSISFDVRVPEGATAYELRVEAELGTDHDQILRITLSDRADGGTRGIPVWGLVGDPASAAYTKWKAGVMQYARLLPPNSHGEPNPADKDPVPLPFDSTFNVPEHDEFLSRVKYVRDDRFLVRNVLDPATRTRLDAAWNDLYSSFDYQDEYLRLLATKLRLDLKGRKIADLNLAAIDHLPEEARRYIRPLRADWEFAMAAQSAAQPGHLEDCLRFASRAWRRPLSVSEQQSLRSFYAAVLRSEKDHRKSIRAVLTRILVSPAFLYRAEPAQVRNATVRPLTSWEMASRLSFFLWSSIPDDELRRAAAAGELLNPVLLERQVKRMTADPKARRFATEFFGQWLGFYRFDQYRGVDTSRFPEFSDEVKTAMYDEAVSFFEHLVRNDRPVGEILNARYTFVNQPLARHYGIEQKLGDKNTLEKIEGADKYGRGGLLRLGAVLTATSAPLRTSPVKRGDWVLRRILGTPTPPPPADAGSIPADEKAFGGLSLREKLRAHQRNATCAGCHTRIDPLGFPLEKYDAVGRVRATYSDGKPVDDSAVTADEFPVAGVDGLLRYLDARQAQVTRTMSQKLLGYALGRTVELSDEPLLRKLSQKGRDATISSLAVMIVQSPQFRNRRDLESEPSAASQQIAARTTR